MKMATRNFKKESEDEHMTRNQKKINVFDFLPDDVLLDILKRFPEAFVRYKAKFVCRRWFNIITRRILLDHASFIIQKSTGNYTKHVDIREEGQVLEVKEQILDIPCRGMIESWCNEFLLIRDLDKKRSIYVFNLITKEGSYLPNCTSCEGDYRCHCGVALSIDRVKGVYKVLRVYMGLPMQCHVLILERDIVSSVSSKWKKIKVPAYMSQGMYSWCHPVSVQGNYFHWSHIPPHLVSLDMVKEKFFQLQLPRLSGSHKINLYSIFVMGGFLTLVGGVTWGNFHIWILKSYERSREWEKLQSITIPDQYLGIFPISSVSTRYIIFKDPRYYDVMYSYDLKYGVVKGLNINMKTGDFCVVHTSAPSTI